ncbi:MAG: glycosyl hydrolase 2 galactose-binding domain-containing protein [Acidimicrobiales bacterium]
MDYVATPVHNRAQRVPVRAWQVMSSAPAPGARLDSGEDISRPGYVAAGWYVAPPRSTVLAALLANGLYQGIERSTAMQQVDRAQFEVPWWYRSTFTAKGDARTSITLDGVIHKADLFVNGSQVATAEETAGAYSVTTFEVSELVQRGTNALALRVYPGSPEDDLSISWVDWNQRPPDNNMGVWRDVVVERTGPIRLSPPAVTTEVSLPGLEAAEVTVSVELANLSEREVVAQLRGRVTGPGTAVALHLDLHLGPKARQLVTFGPDHPDDPDRRLDGLDGLDGPGRPGRPNPGHSGQPGQPGHRNGPAGTPGLRIRQPALWWPAGEGGQPLYDLQLVVADEGDGLVSDQRSSTFGVRSVTSYVAEGGGRRFVVNGRAVQMTGAGWAPDLFLRHDPERTAAELAYALDLGLNTIRLEGKLENEEFFEMADAAGVMVLPGWECCSRWELEKREQGKAWSEHDFVVAERQAASEAVLLRNHPSVVAFLIGSDFAPAPRAAELYVSTLRANRWRVPIVSSATAEGTEAAGPSGMKMTGPYSYVPPLYWYSRDEKRGGAVGFNSETSAGSTIPRLANLSRMLSEEEMEALWRQPEAKQYHAGPPSDFDNLAVFHRALAGRYGKPTSLADFCRKAQLANYETVRAQFEAYSSRAFSPRPATGVVYWMFNSAWPSLNWQLYDWYLGTGGAYFGAKKANQILHALYAYDTGEVQVLNRGHRPAGPLWVEVEVRDLAGAVVSCEDHEVAEVPARSALAVAKAEAPRTGAATYFLALRAAGADGAPVSRNVYWLSTTPDVLDWDHGPWYHTPLAQFADLTGLERLPGTALDVTVTPLAGDGGTGRAEVALRNASAAGTPAVGVHACLVRAGEEAGGRGALAPVRWSDNEVTLFGGDQAVLQATYPLLPGRPLAVDVEGFNVAATRLALG